MLTTPACPHPVTTTSPRPARCTTSAWSSRISGSGSQLPFRSAWWIAKPCSKSVVRGTSPVTSTLPANRNDGSGRSTTSKPMPASAPRLVAGSSHGSRPGSAIRRRDQNSGWISTGRFALPPSARLSPSRPVVWSK